MRGAERWAAVLVLAAMSCRPDRAPDPVILALGQQGVRRSEFERYIAGVEARGGAPLTPEVRRALLETFLEERILVLEARGRGLVVEGSAAAEQAAVERLLKQEVLAKVSVSPEQVDGYCRDRSAEFDRPERVTLRQIVVPTMNEARDLERRLRKDPKSFELLARTRSRAPEASTGGLMGTFEKGQLPVELDAVAFSLPVGETSAIVTTSLGHHVLRVDERQPGRPAGLEECRARAHELLQRQTTDDRVRQYTRDLMARAKVNHEAAQAPASPR